MRPLDTSIDAERVQIDIFRRMAPEQRLKSTIELSQTSRKLLAEGVRKRHPEYSEQQIKYAVFRLLLPYKLFRAAYPSVKEIQP
jgi:hypothetical protein